MCKMNYNIIITNINSLMKEGNITQTQLASEIGMSQPNFSRAICPATKQHFTLEQIYKIAQRFNVSLDFLFGIDNNPSASSEKDICKLITSLIENRKLIHVDFKREEEILTPIHSPNGIPDCEKTSSIINYNAFLFPNYFDPGPLDRYTEYQIDDYQSDMYYNGNQDESNMRINSFFEKYFKLYELYTHNQISEEMFHEIIEKFLTDLQ